jgi:DNA repair exonuclease SbcCD ATPase subunit
VRIEALVVEAFGPFVDRTFEFAPGFNLVHGPNEAGKSSLHAALYAALGGVRRGRGKSGDEESFDRYRPWDREEPWRVRIRLQLADGRCVEVVQDLANKPKSRAFDADFGRDVTS